MLRFRPPSRAQIRGFLGVDDRELIHKFERLFRQSGQDTPDSVEAAEVNQAVSEVSTRALIDELAQSIADKLTDPIATMQDPKTVHLDLTPRPQTRGFFDLQGVNMTGLTDGDLFTFDAASQSIIPISGADGTFTTVDGKTVTVAKGIVTAIV